MKRQLFFLLYRLFALTDAFWYQSLLGGRKQRTLDPKRKESPELLTQHRQWQCVATTDNAHPKYRLHRWCYGWNKWHCLYSATNTDGQEFPSEAVSDAEASNTTNDDVFFREAELVANCDQLPMGISDDFYVTKKSFKKNK